MAYDHRTAYHDLVTYANPYDTLVYSRYSDDEADARRAYDAACELTEHERELLERDLDDLLYYQQHQPGCVDTQWKIVAQQKAAVRAAATAEAAARVRLEWIRDQAREGR